MSQGDPKSTFGATHTQPYYEAESRRRKNSSGASPLRLLYARVTACPTTLSLIAAARRLLGLFIKTRCALELGRNATKAWRGERGSAITQFGLALSSGCSCADVENRANYVQCTV